LDLAHLLAVLSREYAVEVLRQLAENPNGLRHKDFEAVKTPQTRTDTLKDLVAARLIDHEGLTYKLSDKGRKALRLVEALEALE
jgi:DNA-binding HxlR family transcriptional regulator